MRKILLLSSFIVFFISLSAQTVREDIRRDVHCIASNYMAYPNPTQKKLTPAPKGMKPFYISHYGRHGSRFHTKPSIYNAPYTTLQKADSLGKLTPVGRDVLQRLDLIRKDAVNRWGDLTPLGALQQQQIAERMFQRFPEVFKDHAEIDARSTSVGRCVLSMENMLMQLLRLNPRLNLHYDATHRDADILNFQDKRLFALKSNKASLDLYRKYAKRYERHDHLTQLLFNDTAYVRHHVNAPDLALQLLIVAAIMQNTELREEVSLFDIFTEDELYYNWRIGNVRWYIGWGACPVNGGVQPYTQRNLLRRIIQDADSCIGQSKTKVQLRFGHETVLMPLVCLLDLNGYGVAQDDLEQLEEHGWMNYRIFPMGANIQFIFYRRNPTDRNVLFKVLLNENEATLPLPTDTPPYYKWSDFREYYLNKLANFHE